MSDEKKREGAFGLDMKFEEALERFAQTDPSEGAQPAPLKSNKSNELMTKSTTQPAPLTQGVLDLGVEIERNVNGIEMGVLENGIPYLTQTGLATLVGVARSVVYDISKEWASRFDDEILTEDRNSRLRESLAEKGYHDPNLFISIRRDGAIQNAYPDVVCMAVLEFYAFEAKTKNDVAVANYRRLASFGFQQFVYEALGYQPVDPWRHHNDRVSILRDTSPDGYFILFNEMSGLIVDLINAGLTVNNKTIPDISVGIAWGGHWEENNLEAQFGVRRKTEHNYPDYFPQSASNPQPVWAYPDASLPEFRRWFRHDYLPTKFPKYILTKSKLLPGGKSEAAAIGDMYAKRETKKLK